MLIGCVLSSLKVVVSNKFLDGAKLKLHPVDLLYRVAHWSCLWLLICTFVFREHEAVLKAYANPKIWNWTTLAVVAATALLSFLLNVTNFITNKETSPLTLTIGGNVKQVLSILISVMAFGSSLNYVNAFGMSLATVAAVAYSLEREYSAQRSKLKAGQTVRMGPLVGVFVAVTVMTFGSLYALAYYKALAGKHPH